MFSALMLLEPQRRGTTAKHGCQAPPLIPFSCRFHPDAACGVTALKCKYPDSAVFVMVVLTPGERTTLSRRGYNGMGNISTTMCLISCSYITPWSNSFAGMIIGIVAGAACARFHLDTEHRRLCQAPSSMFPQHLNLTSLDCISRSTFNIVSAADALINRGEWRAVYCSLETNTRLASAIYSPLRSLTCYTNSYLLSSGNK